ncbi:hypothetical protein BC826DRAFT_1177162 [Russula brevipes]|nr:hypothetical protein BC826DRAFT_1177162 [Russula brevipes]
MANFEMVHRPLHIPDRTYWYLVKGGKDVRRATDPTHMASRVARLKYGMQERRGTPLAGARSRGLEVVSGNGVTSFWERRGCSKSIVQMMNASSIVTNGGLHVQLALVSWHDHSREKRFRWSLRLRSVSGYMGKGWFGWQCVAILSSMQYIIAHGTLAIEFSRREFVPPKDKTFRTEDTRRAAAKACVRIRRCQEGLEEQRREKK